MPSKILVSRPFGASLMRGLLLLAIAGSSILGAVFLRVCRGNTIREVVTRSLGYKWRAAVEHLLSGVGVPLTFGLIFIGGCVLLCSLAYWGCKLVGLTWKPLARHPRDVMSLGNLPLIAGVIAVVYVFAAFGWEFHQAYGDVYKGPRRGYVQIEQISADMCGALIAVLLAIALTE